MNSCYWMKSLHLLTYKTEGIFIFLSWTFRWNGRWFRAPGPSNIEMLDSWFGRLKDGFEWIQIGREGVCDILGWPELKFIILKTMCSTFLYAVLELLKFYQCTILDFVQTASVFVPFFAILLTSWNWQKVMKKCSNCILAQLKNGKVSLLFTMLVGNGLKYEAKIFGKW